MKQFLQKISSSVKGKFVKKTRLLLLVSAFLFLGFGGILVYAWITPAQTQLNWNHGDRWSIDVSQRADHMMQENPDWRMVNQLEMVLSQDVTLPGAQWVLEVHDVNGDALFPGIQRVRLEYTADLEILGGNIPLSDQGNLSLEEFWDHSLYKPEFFAVKANQPRLLDTWRQKTRVNILSKDTGTQTEWANKQPWWKSFQSDHPALKAELIQVQK